VAGGLKEAKPEFARCLLWGTANRGTQKAGKYSGRSEFFCRKDHLIHILKLKSQMIFPEFPEFIIYKLTL